MAKSKMIQETEDLRAFSDALKAENEILSATLKQKTDELECTQKWYRAGQGEIDRCHKLLDLSAYTPKNGEEYHESDLSIRIMSLLLAVERKITEISFKNKGE